jgi:peroxiredoxin
VIRSVVIALLLAPLPCAQDAQELVRRIAILAAKESPAARLDTLRQLGSVANAPPATLAGPLPLPSIHVDLESAVAALVKQSEHSGGDPAGYNALASIIRANRLSAGLDNPSIRARIALADLREVLDPVLINLNGAPIHLNAYSGKKVVLNFWATWCLPCRVELERLNHKPRPDHVVLLAISDEPLETVRQYIGQRTFSFPILIDPHHQLSDRYRVDTLPATRTYQRPSIVLPQAPPAAPSGPQSDR